MRKELIDRINFLANKKKTVGLNEEELKEQEALRNEYRNEFKKNFINQVENIRVVHSVEENSINELKALAIDEIDAASSGHPGIALGTAPIMYSIFNNELNSYNKDPNWINRDRFVLSAGHASSLLYAFLHVCGFGLTIDDLKNFRKLDSLTPGHPEYRHTLGVDTTSGPLGQGIGMAVGMALAEKKLASMFNKEDMKLIDHYTYVMCGDGDLQEGISQEAISLAGNLNLNKLIILYDSNNITLDGPLSNSNAENALLRFKASGFNTMECDDDYKNITACIELAKKSDKPTIIEVKTVIGKGSVNEGTEKVHGSALAKDDIVSLKEKLNVSKEPFTVSEITYNDFAANFISRGASKYSEWQLLVEEYSKKYPEDYALFKRALNCEFDLSNLENYKCELNAKISTRNASGKILNIIAKDNPFIIGGAADVASSVKTNLSHTSAINRDDFSGQTINFGIREFAMGTVCNGISLHGGLTSFGGAFFVFSDYLKPALRLSALMGLKSLMLFSHDSIAVGEDGPTHQPIEQLASLRSLPNYTCIRPSNEEETKYAYMYALNASNPCSILLTRQDLLTLHKSKYEDFAKGAYFVSYDENSEYSIIATGSEVNLALEVANKLKEDNKLVNVISMPMMDVFEKQTQEYKDYILKSGHDKIITLEMLSSYGWGKYGKYNFGIDTFGKSGKASAVIESFGFDVNSMYENIKNIIE